MWPRRYPGRGHPGPFCILATTLTAPKELQWRCTICVREPSVSTAPMKYLWPTASNESVWVEDTQQGHIAAIMQVQQFIFHIGIWVCRFWLVLFNPLKPFFFFFFRFSWLSTRGNNSHVSTPTQLSHRIVGQSATSSTLLRIRQATRRAWNKEPHQAKLEEWLMCWSDSEWNWTPALLILDQSLCFFWCGQNKMLWRYSIMEQDNARVAWPLQFPFSQPSVAGHRVPHRK